MELKEKYNRFFVKSFNLILKNEEKMLSEIDKKLTIKEIHLLDAINTACKHNTFKEIAKKLKISAGTLTVAVHTLEKKEYIFREKDAVDKRVSRLGLTKKGVAACLLHEKFHNKMIDGVARNLTATESEILVSALEKLKEYLEKNED